MADGSWTAQDLGYNRARFPRIPELAAPHAYGCRADGTGKAVGYSCARPKGHTGRHLARGFEGTVHAVWE